MNLILYGSTGYIGSEFSRQINARGWNVGCLSHGSVMPNLRLELDGLRPGETDAVINCAAFICKPSVDLNNDWKEDTLLGNLVLPAQLACICEGYDVPLMQISTGCLFTDIQKVNGTKFNEEDCPDLSLDLGAGYYVGSKELAEQVVRKMNKHWICRTRLPFDHIDRPRNFLSKLIGFKKVLDTYNSYSHRGDFVNACLDMIEHRVPWGTYNCTNAGAIWSHEIISMLLDANLIKGVEYWLRDEFLKTRKTPMSNCELDISKLLATGIKMRSVHESMADSIKNWVRA